MDKKEVREMKPKFYFKNGDSELCYPEEYFKKYMKEHHLTEMEVFKAIPEITGGGVFWCKEYDFCGDDSREYCGKQCDKYEPKNKKSGVCRHHTHWLYNHGEKIKLYI